MRFSIDKDNVEAARVLQAYCQRRGPRQMLAEPRFLAGESAMCWKEEHCACPGTENLPLSTLSIGQDDAASEGAFPRSEPGKGSTNGQASGSL